MNIILLDNDADEYEDPHLSNECIKQLQKQGINLDKWDLILMIPPEQCYPQEVSKEEYDEEGEYYYEKMISKTMPSWNIILFVDSDWNDEEWYEDIEFEGNKWVVGVKR